MNKILKRNDEEIILRIEKRIAVMISENFIGSEDVKDSAILLSLLFYGEELTLGVFDCKTFIKNLKDNGAMSQDGKLYISKGEQEEYLGIWFCMTLNVGRGFLMRK